MKSRDAVPRVMIEADVILPLEAPSDEATAPGGFHGPHPAYVEIQLAGHAPGLDEALSRWDAEAWGGQA